MRSRPKSLLDAVLCLFDLEPTICFSAPRRAAVFKHPAAFTRGVCPASTNSGQESWFHRRELVLAGADASKQNQAGENDTPVEQGLVLGSAGRTGNYNRRIRRPLLHRCPCSRGPCSDRTELLCGAVPICGDHHSRSSSRPSAKRLQKSMSSGRRLGWDGSSAIDAL